MSVPAVGPLDVQKAANRRFGFGGAQGHEKKPVSEARQE
jgi:hypothetical protein